MITGHDGDRSAPRMDNDISTLFFCSKKDIQYRSDSADDGSVRLNEIVDIIIDAFDHFPGRGDNFSAAYLGRNRFSKRLKSIGIGRPNSLFQKDNRPISELPNVASTVFVEFTLRTGYAVFFMGALSFLGYAAKPPTPEWGLMINEGRAVISAAPWMVLGPALALASLVVALGLFTEGLSETLGLTSQRQRAK